MGISLMHRTGDKTKGVEEPQKPLRKEVAKFKMPLIAVKRELIEKLADRKNHKGIPIIENFTQAKINLIKEEIKKTGSFAIPYENVTEAIGTLGQEFDIEPNGGRHMFILRAKS